MPPDADPADSYFDYLIGTKDNTRKTPEWTEAITGVPADTIRSLARRYATSRPAALLQGYGGQRHLNGEQSARGGIMLACLTGNVGVSGGWASGAGYCEMVKEPLLPSVKNPVEKLIPVYEWTRHVENNDIRMIFNLAGNALLNQHGDIYYTKSLLQDEAKCEFIVCSDIFLTASARYADILLPGISMFEGNNLTAPWVQGDHLNAVNKIIEPLGECRQEYDWIKEIAANIGLYEAFTEGNDTVEDWRKTIYDRLRSDEPQLPQYQDFIKLGVVRLKGKRPKIAFADRRFPTRSGKVEIYSPDLSALSCEAIPPVPGYVPESEGVGTDPSHPLSLVGWHTISRAHTVHDSNRKLQTRHRQELWMNPEDAAHRNIQNSDTVLVHNRRGQFKVPVYVTDDIKKGCVALAQGAWYQPEQNSSADINGSINILTTLQTSPLAHGNGQHTCLVEVTGI